MKPTVYIETTVISYLAARPTDNVVPEAQHQLTRQWWTHHRSQFAMFTSQLVLDEAAVGEPAQVAERLSLLKNVDLLAIASAAEPLAEKLLAEGALMSKARLEALHVAVATVNGVEFFMTWDCRHLANAVLREAIRRSCRAAGYEPPVICTPYELMGVDL